MNIDICRTCPNWREELCVWNSVSGEKVGVNLHCTKFRTPRWGQNLDRANSGLVKKLCMEKNRITIAHTDNGYMQALGEADSELHEKFAGLEEHRIPSDCERKCEYAIRTWNR